MAFQVRSRCLRRWARRGFGKRFLMTRRATWPAAPSFVFVHLDHSPDKARRTRDASRRARSWCPLPTHSKLLERIVAAPPDAVASLHPTTCSLTIFLPHPPRPARRFGCECFFAAAATVRVSSGGEPGGGQRHGLALQGKLGHGRPLGVRSHGVAANAVPTWGEANWRTGEAPGGRPLGKAVQVDIITSIPVLRALVFQLVESTSLYKPFVSNTNLHPLNVGAPRRCCAWG